MQQLSYRLAVVQQLAGLVYGAGMVDTSLPFDELRRRSQIDDAAHAADGSKDFSALIRASLPVPAPN